MEEKLRVKMVEDQLKKEGLMVGMVKRESSGNQSVVSVERNSIQKDKGLDDDANNLVALVNRIKPALQSALI